MKLLVILFTSIIDINIKIRSYNATDSVAQYLQSINFWKSKPVIQGST